jgi:anthraniloyl-CoA monooxygenase
VRFAVNLLTRSGRISYANLTQRDPELVRRSDAAFAAAAAVSGDRPARRLAPPPVFVPAEVGRLRLANRVVTSPPGLDDASDGSPSRAMGDRLREAAASGAGLVLSELVAVASEGRITPGTPGMYEEAQRTAWTTIVEDAHRTESAFGLRIGHAGPRGATRSRSLGIDLPLAEPWPLLDPAEMTRAEMDRVRGDFERSATWAAEAGADLLEVDAAHGYLLGAFCSPLTNPRSDAFGGPLENRMRFPLAVVDAVRAAWPSDRPLAVRLPATDWSRGGFGLDDAVGLANAVRDLGADLVHVVGGTARRADPEYGPGYLVAFADRIRNEAGVAVIVEGRVWTLDQANTILAAGRGDLVVLDYAPTS